MAQLLTSAQMRAIEKTAIDTGNVTGLDLMERAGRGVVGAIHDTWPETADSPGRALVLCGPGNNGGDGFVIARLLHDLGWEVLVLLHGAAEQLPPDARRNHDRWLERGSVSRLTTATALDALDEEAAPEERPRGPGMPPDRLIVDAIFGTGLSRPPGSELSPVLARLADLAGRRHARVVAVDLPSGLCADSGARLSAQGCAAARLTVTFHRAKIGHFLADGPAACGRLAVHDIGLPAGMPAALSEPMVHVADRGAGASAAKRGGHKFCHGHALVLSGPARRSGAARLAARGAARIGAGLVTVAAPGSALMECASQLTAIMLDRCDDGDDLRALLEDDRITALCMGPGLGLSRARELWAAASDRPGLSVVLDADALSAFADAPDALFAGLDDRCVLTPHAGEFRRLFPDLHERLTGRPDAGPVFSKLDATRAAAARAGCTVLLKGPDTVIAAADGRCTVCAASYDRAVPWLATAGAGDVLAGFITGLLARGVDPMQAAETAAWLHVGCALEFGPGLMAEDLPETLPTVLRGLGL